MRWRRRGTRNGDPRIAEAHGKSGATTRFTPWGEGRQRARSRKRLASLPSRPSVQNSCSSLGLAAGNAGIRIGKLFPVGFQRSLRLKPLPLPLQNQRSPIRLPLNIGPADCAPRTRSPRSPHGCKFPWSSRPHARKAREIPPPSLFQMSSCSKNQSPTHALTSNHRKANLHPIRSFNAFQPSPQAARPQRLQSPATLRLPELTRNDKGGYEWEKIEVQKALPLTQQQWNDLVALTSADGAREPSQKAEKELRENFVEAMSGLDGSTWYLEVRDRKGYTVEGVPNPLVGDEQEVKRIKETTHLDFRPFLAVCLKLFEFSGLDHRPDY